MYTSLDVLERLMSIFIIRINHPSLWTLSAQKPLLPTCNIIVFDWVSDDKLSTAAGEVKLWSQSVDHPQWAVLRTATSESPSFVCNVKSYGFCLWRRKISLEDVCVLCSLERFQGFGHQLIESSYPNPFPASFLSHSSDLSHDLWPGQRHGEDSEPDRHDAAAVSLGRLPTVPGAHVTGFPRRLLGVQK